MTKQEKYLEDNGYIRTSPFYYQKNVSNTYPKIYSNIYIKNGRVLFSHSDISFECILESERNVKALKYTLSLAWKKHFQMIEDLKKYE